MSSQQLVDAFKEVSGCSDTNEAQNYLNACDGNLEQAVNLFFTQTTRKRQRVVNNSAGASTSKKAYQEKNGAQITKDVSMIDLSDDEGSPTSGFDNVRAPIAPVHGAIVEQSFQQSYETRRGPSNPIFEQYHDFRQVAEQQDNNLKRRVAHTSKSAVNDELEVVNGRRAYNIHQYNDADDGVEVIAESSRNGALRKNGTRNGQADNLNAPSKPTKDLKTLFRPPVEIMFQKDWNSTLAEARTQKVWLMVNVQMAAEFSCQVLNRDIWSEPTVREVIRGNFLFWQVYHDSSDGVRVRSYYEIHGFPAIFIVDPRTGEEVQKLRAQDPVSFLDQVTAFLEKFPSFEVRDDTISGRRIEQSMTFVTNDSKPDVSRESSNNSTNPQNGSAAARRNRKHKHNVSEDSWKTSAEDFENSASIEAKRMKRIVNINDDSEDQMIAEPSSNIPSSSTSNAFSGVSVDEWKDYANETSTDSKPVQLLLRLPNGEKHNISVFESAKLKALFLFIAGRDLSPVEHHLVLSFPKRIFNFDDKEKTLEEAGFKHQEVIHVERI